MEKEISGGLLSSESDVEILTGERGRMDDVALYYSAQIQRYPLLTAEKELEYLSSYFEDRDSSTMGVLVNHNLRMVCSRARRFLWTNLPLSDLIQEGVIGLMEAIERFEPMKGFRLSTYAIHHIDNKIRRYVQENSSSVWVPINVQSLSRKVQRKLKSASGSQGERERQVAEELGITVERLRVTATAASFDFVSIDTLIGDDEGRLLVDTLVDSTHLNPFEASLVRSELRQTLEEKTYVYGLLSSFTLTKKRDIKIFLARTGLVGVKGVTSLDVIAKDHEISRQAVDQVVRRIYAKLSRCDRKLTKAYIENLVRKADALRAIAEAL